MLNIPTSATFVTTSIITLLITVVADGYSIAVLYNEEDSQPSQPNTTTGLRMMSYVINVSALKLPMRMAYCILACIMAMFSQTRPAADVIVLLVVFMVCIVVSTYDVSKKLAEYNNNGECKLPIAVGGLNMGAIVLSVSITF